MPAVPAVPAVVVVGVDTAVVTVDAVVVAVDAGVDVVVIAGAFVVAVVLVQRRPDLVFVHFKLPLLAPAFVQRPFTDAADAGEWNAVPTSIATTDAAPRTR